MFSPEEKQQLVEAATQSLLDQPQPKLALYLKERGAALSHINWGPEGAHPLSFDERCDRIYRFLTAPGEDITDKIL